MARMFARLDTVTDGLETWIDEMQPDMMIKALDLDRRNVTVPQ
jgi:Holliday junction resolvasome RuvABC endonuclease subunit